MFSSLRRPMAMLAIPSRVTDSGPLYDAWHTTKALPPWTQRSFDLSQFSDPSRRGARAREHVSQGDLLVSVPWESVLAVGAADRESGAKLAELLWREMNSALPSVWKFYSTALLPTDEDVPAVFWTEEEIAALQLSPQENIKLLSARANLVEQRRRLVGKLKTNSKSVSDKELEWCQRMVWSRSLGIVGGNSNDGYATGDLEWRVLAPIVDLLNHRPESPLTMTAVETEGNFSNPWSVINDFSGRPQRVELRAPYETQKDQELLIPYGCETNLELLSQYGFFMPNESNEANFMEIFEDFEDLGKEVAQARSETDAPEFQSRINLLQNLDAAAAPLAVRPGAREASNHLISSIAFLLASEDELAHFQEAYDPQVGHFTLVIEGLARDDKASLLSRAWELAALRCRQILETYPTSLTEDLLQLQTDQANSRLQLATEFRVDAKKLLHSFVQRK